MSSAHAYCTVCITQATHITKYTVCRQISLLKKPKEAVFSDHEKRFNSIIMHPRVHPSLHPSFHASLPPFIFTCIPPSIRPSLHTSFYAFIFTYMPHFITTYLSSFLLFSLRRTHTHATYYHLLSYFLSLSLSCQHTHTAYVSLHSVNFSDTISSSINLPSFLLRLLLHFS